MRKKLIITALSVLFAVVIVCLPYWINDFACLIYRNEIKDSVENISGLNVLQTVNGCGNSGGTGNHTDLTKQKQGAAVK